MSILDNPRAIITGGLRLLDKYGNELRTIDFIELQWNRKWIEPGDFTLYVATKDWNKDIKYVQLGGRPETGIVQKIAYEKKSNGEFITASGFFIEKLLEWITPGTTYSVTSSGNTLEDRKALLWTLYNNSSQYFPREFDEYGGKIQPPITVPFPYPNFYGMQVEGGSLPTLFNATCGKDQNIGQMIYKWCNDSNIGIYCTPIFNPGKGNVDSTEPLLGLELHFVQGSNLTESVYFGTSWDNTKEITYMVDESNVYSRCIAFQEIGEATGMTDVYTINEPDGIKKYIIEDQNIVTNRPSDLGVCNPVKVIYTQISDIEMIPANENKIRELMRQEARLALLNTYRIEEVNCQVIQNRYYYLQEYDLGDKVTVSIDALETMYSVKIVEVHEIHHKNTAEIEIILGSPQKSKYRKVVV